MGGFVTRRTGERLTHAPEKENAMSYCIMRVEKRQQAAVYGLQIEANRTIDDHEKGRDFAASDIAWELTPFNVHLVRADSWRAAIKTALEDAGVQTRKNSVVLLDGFYGASKDWFVDKSMDEIVDYFKSCLAFHEKYYGKVINAVIHFDEATPHLAVASIPLISDDKGTRLSAKEIMGNRNDYRKRQDLFYLEVGKERGMERGESHDPENIRKHLTVQEFKSQAFEVETEKLIEQNKELRQECKVLLQKNQSLQEMNAALSEQIEQPFLHYCMRQFIRNAKVRGENGQIKSVMDGYNAYMERNVERLREEWKREFQLEPMLPTGNMEEVREHEREMEYDYEEREL